MSRCRYCGDATVAPTVCHACDDLPALDLGAAIERAYQAWVRSQPQLPLELWPDRKGAHVPAISPEPGVGRPPLWGCDDQGPPLVVHDGEGESPLLPGRPTETPRVRDAHPHNTPPTRRGAPPC